MIFRAAPAPPCSACWMRKADGLQAPISARRRASRACKKLDPRTLVAAGYMLLLTTLPSTEYDARRIAALYRLSWQIELVFKRLKSLVHIDMLPARDKRLARSWLAAHLIIALMTENFAGEFPDSPP